MNWARWGCQMATEPRCWLEDIRQDSLGRLGQAGTQEYAQGQEGAGVGGHWAWAPMHRGQAVEQPGTRGQEHRLHLRTQKGSSSREDRAACG